MSDTYVVVVNAEEQYSIWRDDDPPPDGWQTVGVRGTRDECLDHIEKVWTDIRPLSMRRLTTQTQLDEAGPDRPVYSRHARRHPLDHGG